MQAEEASRCLQSLQPNKQARKNLKAARQLHAEKNVFELKELAGVQSRPAPPVTSVPYWKRVLDIGCLLLALPTLLPLMLLIAALIKIVSPGPVFFRQERIGFMGRRFKILKFRSMRVNAEVNSHQNHLKDLISSNTPMTKMDSKGDPRVIPLGSLLRSSGLDELPQLINVLKGEMSLVGP